MRKLGFLVASAVALLALALLPHYGTAQTGIAQQRPTAGLWLPLVLRPASTATATTTATASRTATLATGPTMTASRTATSLVSATNPPPTLPPSLNACRADPNASQAPNFPVKIVAINKSAETVTLKSLSGASVDLTGWTMCSILGNQQHPISGTLAPEEQRVFLGPAENIWNNSQQDDGALYDSEGRLVSYFSDTDFLP